MLQNAKSILITGGCGTLGKAILRRSVREKWEARITVLSTDAIKHFAVKREFPHVHSVIADIRDTVTLYNAMAGHDVVIHAAAVKHIPVGEENPIDTYQINVEGSLNVANCAIQHGVKHVIGISTDKVCHAANAYGATKYLMEKIFQEYSRSPFETKFNLVRYGNVLESTGSVIQIWKEQIARGEPIRVTDPNMTRFYISPSNAVDLVLNCMKLESGMILIPKMKSLSLRRLAEYTLPKGFEVDLVQMRAGEKMHETLLTVEECDFAIESEDYFFLRPTTSKRNDQFVDNPSPYSSEISDELTQAELLALLEDK